MVFFLGMFVFGFPTLQAGSDNRWLKRFIHPSLLLTKIQ